MSRTLIARDLELNFGRTIPALASIADLSILEISSRTAKARQSWSVILKVRQILCFVNVGSYLDAREQKLCISALRCVGKGNQPVPPSVLETHSTM